MKIMDALYWQHFRYLITECKKNFAGGRRLGRGVEVREAMVGKGGEILDCKPPEIRS
jgi:hypothetical protein